jgi:hypothetical protein
MDHTEKNASNCSSVVAYVFLATATFLLSRCLPTYMYRHRLMGGIYEVCRWMGSGAMLYIPSFIKISSGIQKLIREDNREEGDCISLL